MVKIFTTKYQFLGRILLTLLLAVVSCVNVWAADKTVSSEETYTGTYTVNVGETLKITSTGVFKITGNLINNGGTIIVDGGTLEVGGKLDNKVVASGETDQDWKSNGNSTEKYFKNSDYSGSGSNNNNTSKYSSFDTPYRKTTQPQKAVTNQNTYIGNISIINGNLSVSGNVTNAGNVSVKTTDATSIARIAISGNFENISTTLTLKTYTYTRDKITKEVRKSNKDWSNSNIISTEESYNPENPKATEGTTQTVSSATITLDNGYLVVNGDATLENGSQVSYEQTTTGLSAEVDGSDVAIMSTIRVAGNVTQNETAVIKLDSGEEGTLLVEGRYIDNSSMEDDTYHPWYLANDKLSITEGFVFNAGSYVSDLTLEKEQELLDEIKNKLDNSTLNDYLIETYPDDYNKYLTGRSILTGQKYTSVYPTFYDYFTSNWRIITPGESEQTITTEYNTFLTDLRKQFEDQNELVAAIESLMELLNDEGINSNDLENNSGQISSLLPITLNYFTAEQDGEEVVFEWQTSSEVNNDFFTIEYSIDGVHFKELLREDGNGTTSVTNDYYATASAEEFAGITYFRLKQTDFNGEYSYSDVIFVSIVSEETELYVFPNPTTDYVSVSGNVASAYVSDMYGRNMSCLQTSENTFAVAGLSVGTYYVVVSTKNGKKVLPFVKK